ncbi:MAG TPA: N-6 DNA methylase [Pseudolabrys sp.]|nr:N-6 DNA methylase [Pseudolabrys sp.]
MFEAEARGAIRNAARAYEEALPAGKRKQLGQFFTGLPLGKLLAHLALETHTTTILDPMAGNGDLLDATWEAAAQQGIPLERLDGIEIDAPTAAACRRRLEQITSGDLKRPELGIVAGDAFDPASVSALPCRLYDLVITNPPYVRYQARGTNGSKSDPVRAGVAATALSSAGPAANVWSVLIESYSGLADLSVPAWLLAASLVRPGGRLALVVPATWRSRDYADVIRYLMLRCFDLEFIVEDTQPGWFSDALVRTHLIVARRLESGGALPSLARRTNWPSAVWLQVAPEAAGGDCLVGSAFDGDHSEAQFAGWARGDRASSARGISARPFSSQEEWASLAPRIRRRRWYHALEGATDDLPLFAAHQSPARIIVPEPLRDLLPAGFAPGGLRTLAEQGIQVGQGLRTGCNRFFYVTACGSPDRGRVSVEASSLFQHRRFAVPSGAIRPVLRRQAELRVLEDGDIPDGRVLDLRRWVLPEDSEAVAAAAALYAACGEAPPEIMPDDLAAYVRAAAAASTDDAGGKLIPQLSAVATNVRIARGGNITPRFWYMLPDFTPRHLPAAFVPRINDGVPWVECNRDPALLIDANFSTFWAPNGEWPRHALKALLNSTWCRAFMEAIGTPLGGGALKLEATHLRHLPVPVLSAAAKRDLEQAGRQLTRDAADTLLRIDGIVLGAVLEGAPANVAASRLAQALTERAHSLSAARQRAA